MIPQLFSIGPIPINSFGLMVALSLLASMYLLTRSFERLGLDPKKAESYVFIGGFSGLFGARLWYIGENWTSVNHHLLEAITSSAGFTFYGGLIITFIVMWILCKKDLIPFTKFLDASGPTMTMGYAIGRVGCQLSGDGDYGKFTDSFFGMSYMTGIVPTPPGFLAYPTPLYESTLCFLILAILLSVETKMEWQTPLKRFGLYLSLIATERFFVEFLRINPSIAGKLSEAQILSVVFCVIGVALVIKRPYAQATQH